MRKFLSVLVLFVMAVSFVPFNTSALASAKNNISNVVVDDSVAAYRSSVDLRSDNLPVIAFRDANNMVKVVRCLDAACTQTQANMLPISGSYIASNIIVKVLNNNPNVLFTKLVNGQTSISLFECSNENCTSGSERTLMSSITLAQENTNNKAMDFDYDHNGLPLVVFSYTDAGQEKVHLIKGLQNCPGCWGSVAIDNGTNPRVEVLGSDVFIAYQKGSEIWKTVCYSSNCYNHQPAQIIASANPSSMDLTVTSQGITLGYVSNPGKELVLMKCNSVTCAVNSTSVVQYWVEGFSFMGHDDNGNIDIAYATQILSGSNVRLYMKECAQTYSSACSSVVRNVQIDAGSGAGNVGYLSSTFYKAGKTYISHFDNTNSDLRFSVFTR